MKKLLLFGALAMSATTFSHAASIINLDTQKEYTSLKTALNEIATGETLQLNENVDYDYFINPGVKDITIIGAATDGSISINHILETDATSLRSFINLNASATGSLNLKNITINAGGNQTTNNFIAQANGSLVMENVTIKDLIYNANNPGIIRLTGTPVATVLDNVKFENCKSTYDVNNAVAASTLTIKGSCDYNIWLNNKAAFIIDGGITTSDKVNLYAENHTVNVPAVKGNTNPMMFNLIGSTKQLLSPVDGNLNIIAYQPILLINDIEGVKTGATYTALNGTLANATENGAQVLIYGDVNYTSGWSFSGKTVTFQGMESGVTINRTSDKILMNANNSGTHLIFNDITINTELASQPNYLASASSNSKSPASVTLNNVVIKNCNTSAEAIINAGTNGSWHLNNVTFENCLVDGELPIAKATTTGSSVSGIINGLSLALNDGATVDAEGLSAESDPIALTLGGTFYHDTPVITNCDNESLFTITNKGWSLMADNGGIKALEDKVVTGIEEVAAVAEGAAEYFDLNGMRVNAENLTPGIYVKRQDGKASKIAIR